MQFQYREYVLAIGEVIIEIIQELNYLQVLHDKFTFCMWISINNLNFENLFPDISQ